MAGNVHMVGYHKRMEYDHFQQVDFTAVFGFAHSFIFARHPKQLSKFGNVIRVFTWQTWMWTGISLAAMALAFKISVSFYQTFHPMSLSRRTLLTSDIVLHTIAGVSEPDQIKWFRPSALTGKNNHSNHGQSVSRNLHP